MKLSAAYAVYNEQDTIKKSVMSVYRWVDEIVVVDGKSTDDTVKILRKLDKDKKIRILSRPNPAMFHENKQIAIDACKGAWILQLDADEVVSKELKEEVCATVHKDTPDINGYWLPRLNYFLGQPLRKGGQYPDMTLRLYRNGKGRLPCKSVHEQAEVDGDVGELSHDLLHYPYPTFRAFLEKWVRYGVLEGQHASLKRPTAGRFFNYMVIKPKMWFLKAYFRHKGFMDGFPGFVFALFSSLRFWIEYIVIYERYQKENT